MRSIGTVKMQDEEYIIMLEYQKNVTYYYLLSQYHTEDRKGMIFDKQLKYPVCDIISYLYNPVDINYIVAAIQKKNIGGEIKYYGIYQLLFEVIQSIQIALSYSFKSQDILLDISDKVSLKGEFIREFSGKDSSVSIYYRKNGGFVEVLDYKSALLEISFKGAENYKFPKHREIGSLMNDLNSEDAGVSLFYSNVKSIDYDSVLKSMPDSKWFREILPDGTEKFNKDYRAIYTISDFEKEVILDLINEIKKARKEGNLPVLISVDTETTGLHVYNVPTELQSKIVAIPFSCRDNCGLTIFTDMEYFDNISISYVKKRLEPFVKKDISEDNEIIIDTIEGQFKFRRSEIFNTGHNIMFDIKSSQVHEMEIYYDADTMQMSFSLDPFLTKRKNSLKYITHKLLKCWTPELSDVLGKGNEDKFKYITDRRLAALYGGSDADFGRLVFKALKSIFYECREFHQKDLFRVCLEQDILLMNVIAKADYDGIRIDRERFVEEGKLVQKDIEIISEFTYKYVGRIIAANNYLYQIKLMENQGLDISSVPKPDLENAPPYEFKFAGNSLIYTLYVILNYPIFVWTESSKSKSDTNSSEITKPKPAINKTAMKKLMTCKYEKPQPILKNDIKSASGKTLINAKEFNQLKYPVAYLVSLIGPRKKEYDAYFKPFVEDSYGNKLCKDSKFSAIDTRRISNPIQTIKGSLKRFMLPYDDTYAMCDFDMSQVELRIMTSLASDMYMIERMKDPEVDSHTEVASEMFFKAAYLISKHERSYAKQVNFGYPYGLTRYSMCEKIFGNTKDENLAATQRIIETFEKVKHIVVSFLNEVRDNTLKPVKIPQCLRSYLELGDEIPVGVVRNLKGFYKLFPLDDLDEKKAQRIRRQSGNFPIQSFAAELFRIVLMRLYRAFWKEGWIQKDWIKWHVLVHDELLFSFKKSLIHPIHLTKIIHEACTITIAGHTNYYIGINIGDNWGDCKDDQNELPVYMVSRLIKRWDCEEFIGETVDDPKTYMSKLRQEYISDRIYEVIESMCPEVSDGKVDCNHILANFKNYTVRKYVYDCYTPLWTLKENDNGKTDETEQFDSNLASWALERFGDGTLFITSNKKEIILHNSLKSQMRIVNGKEVPFTFAEMFNEEEINFESLIINFDTGILSEDIDTDTYYKEVSWDLGENSNPYFIDYNAESSESESSFEDEFDETAGNTFESMRIVQPLKFKTCEIAGKRVKINVPRKYYVSKIESFITQNNFTDNEGFQIIYSSKIFTVKGSIIKKDSLSEIDSFVEKLRM